MNRIRRAALGVGAALIALGRLLVEWGVRQDAETNTPRLPGDLEGEG